MLLHSLLALAALASALPIENKIREPQADLQSRDIQLDAVVEMFNKVERGEPVPDELTSILSGAIVERDYPLLTTLFTQLNQSGAALPILKALCTNPLTQGTTIDAIESYVEQKTLPVILKAATDSGLAFDIVMSFFTDYNMVPGLVKIGKALYNSGAISFKREDLDDALEKRNELFERELSQFSLEERGLIGDLLNGVGGIFGITPVPTATKAATTVGTTTPTTVGTTVGTTAGTAVASSAASTGTSSLVSPNTPSTLTTKTTASTSAPAFNWFGTGTTTKPSSTFSASGTASRVASSVKVSSTRASASATASATAAATSSSGGSLLGGLFGGLGALIGGGSGVLSGVIGNTISTIGDTLNNIVGGTTTTIGNTIGSLVNGDVAGAIDNALSGTIETLTGSASGAVSGLSSVFTDALSGTQQTIISAVIAGIKDVGDLEQICESLQKSGLGVSVVRYLITDSEMQDFVVKLVTQMIKDKVITLSILLDAASQSNVIWNTLSRIITSPSALSAIFAWILWAVSNINVILG